MENKKDDQINQATPASDSPASAPSAPASASPAPKQEAQPTEAKPQEAPPTEAKPEAPKLVKLQAVYAFKLGMSSVFDAKGRMVPVTVLKFEPQVVSQIKNPTQDGYSSVQLAFGLRRGRSKPKAHTTRLKNLGALSFEKGVRYVREVRQDTKGIEVGQKVSIESLAAGDRVKVTARSKGRGFAGTMKRWGFGGGPASHGAGFHRKPGSVGNCVEPGRVMPGLKMSGHFGDQRHTRARVEVVEVLKDEQVVLVKGPVPGSRNSLVYLQKQVSRAG